MRELLFFELKTEKNANIGDGCSLVGQYKGIRFLPDFTFMYRIREWSSPLLHYSWDCILT